MKTRYADMINKMFFKKSISDTDQSYMWIEDIKLQCTSEYFLWSWKRWSQSTHLWLIRSLPNNGIFSFFKTNQMNKSVCRCMCSCRSSFSLHAQAFMLKLTMPWFPLCTHPKSFSEKPKSQELTLSLKSEIIMWSMFQRWSKWHILTMWNRPQTPSKTRF